MGMLVYRQDALRMKHYRNLQPGELDFGVSLIYCKI